MKRAPYVYASGPLASSQPPHLAPAPAPAPVRPGTSHTIRPPRTTTLYGGPPRSASVAGLFEPHSRCSKSLRELGLVPGPVRGTFVPAPSAGPAAAPVPASRPPSRFQQTTLPNQLPSIMPGRLTLPNQLQSQMPRIATPFITPAPPRLPPPIATPFVKPAAPTRAPNASQFFKPAAPVRPPVATPFVKPAPLVRAPTRTPARTPAPPPAPAPLASPFTYKSAAPAAPAAPARAPVPTNPANLPPFPPVPACIYNELQSTFAQLEAAKKQMGEVLERNEHRFNPCGPYDEPASKYRRAYIRACNAVDHRRDISDRRLFYGTPGR